MIFDDALLTTTGRPDPRRQAPDLYPERFTVRFRHADVDSYGHVNNVAMDALHEDARSTLLERGWPRVNGLRPVQIIAVQHVTHFLAEGFYPGTVELCAGVGRLGASSFVVSTALIDGQRCLSLADTTLVLRRDGVIGALTEADRDTLRALALHAG